MADSERIYPLFYNVIFPFSPNNSIRATCHKVLCGVLTFWANVMAARGPFDCGNEVNDEFNC